ncbi:hypothetical protein SRS16CHR_03601 [Variovorax sp. SRS16]|uniref:hypothetical protein n=1 Tax=Variovorax sp. SRS16 TaxID=282217 RepID=UPI0013190A71|nr:hypothetical protein [Variovorax sp. SRS16]VTU25144.1 hypothetical protein SRS16CHR_03601 [Variovorax sp. SRS16]
MPQQFEQRTYVSEEVVEVRFNPRGSILNHMGDFADYIVDKDLFKHWALEPGMIKFKDAPGEPQQVHAFLSHRNAGFVAISPPTQNFFRDKAIQYWQAVAANPLFKVPKIIRIGMRNRCFTRVNKDFAGIEKALYSYLYRPEAMEDLSPFRTDHQAVFNFAKGEIKTNVTIGPLKKKEAAALFNFKSEHFAHEGVYIDLDVYIDEPKQESKTVEDFIRNTTKESWARIENLLSKMGA